MRHIITTIAWNNANWTNMEAEVGKFGFQRETGDKGHEGMNFHRKHGIHGGFKYAYFPQNKIGSVIEDDDNGKWCLVFTSRNPDTETRYIVGLYLNAHIIEHDQAHNLSNIKVRPQDIVALEPTLYLPLTPTHSDNKQSNRPLVYISDKALKKVFSDILGLYSDNKYIVNQLKKYIPGITPSKGLAKRKKAIKARLTSCEEGDTKEITVEIRSRNPELKKLAIAKYGYGCQVCGFSYQQAYGIDYIEIHHKKPLSKRKSGKHTVKVSDVCVVCANCHRMLHKSKHSVLPIEELQNRLKVKFAYSS